VAADATDRDSLDRFLDRVDLVINCAGPYTELGLPVAQAALSAGVHLLDLSGEQVYVRECEQLDEGASRSGVVLGNAMGVEVALSDCAAALAARGLSAIEEIRVAGAVSGFRTSRASRMSALEAIWGEGVRRTGGRFERAAVAHESRQFDLHAPFGVSTCAWYPGVEILTIPRHLSAATVATYIRVPAVASAPLKWMGAAAALPLRLASASDHMAGFGGNGGSGMARKGLRRCLRLVRNAAGRLGGEPCTERPSPFEIRVEVLGRGTSGIEYRGVSVLGRDPYGLSAEIVVRSALRLLEHGPAVGRGGVLAPAQVVDPGWLFSVLEPLDCYDLEVRDLEERNRDSQPPQAPGSESR
jgi:short subunit dehydrogenase-like uncharacterized protein